MNIRIIYLPIILSSVSCSGYLNEIPDRSLAILSTVQQYEELLNYEVLYTAAPAIQEYGTDIFSLSYPTWQSLDIRARPSYVWQADIYEGNNALGVIQDWAYPYRTIHYCNIVLDGLDEVETIQDHRKYVEVKGHALFLRAYQHYLLSQVYGQPYRPESAARDLGIPMKLSSDLEAKVERASVAATYEQILSDCEEALKLLPTDYQAVNNRRASKATVHAFLSRIYLTMQNFEKSRSHADSCLKRYSALLDYNDLRPTFQLPLFGNREVLFFTTQSGTSSFYQSANTTVASSFYESYDEHDLRKRVFFNYDSNSSNAYFNTLYSGSANPFSGLATDEVYLNRAECHARLGDESLALEDINTLLTHRYEAGYFTPISLGDVSDVLAFILEERKKELVVRGTRWSDLRRLNQDSRSAVTLARSWDEAEFELPPNDSRYTYPIPDKEVLVNDFPQNIRTEY